MASQEERSVRDGKRHLNQTPTLSITCMDWAGKGVAGTNTEHDLYGLGRERGGRYQNLASPVWTGQGKG